MYCLAGLLLRGRRAQVRGRTLRRHRRSGHPLRPPLPPALSQQVPASLVNKLTLPR